MLQLRVLIIFTGLTLTYIIDGQLNPSVCPTGPTDVVDPRWPVIPSRFEIATELISGTEMLELSQTFSAFRDAITATSRNGILRFYWDFSTAEKFDVLTSVVKQQVSFFCVRQTLQPTSETSVLLPNTLILKPSVLLGFNSRNEVNTLWGNIYVGDENLRGIPINKFTSCFYLPDIKATVSATYYVSDVTKVLVPGSRNTSAILQIDVNIINSAGHTESFQYNVFRYVPNPTHEEERLSLKTPPGVYCPNRTSTISAMGNLPDQISHNSEVSVPQLNSSIVSSYDLYDNDLQFSRSAVWYPDPHGGPETLHYIELHDFASGLNYQYNLSTGQCTVRDIIPGVSDAVLVDGKPNLAQMGSLQDLFSMDNLSYQYTGEGRCGDRVLCHEWVGEKLLSNNQVEHREWYWASVVNGQPLVEWIPKKIVLKKYINGILSFTLERNIFNFHRSSNILFEIDQTMTDCYRAMGSKNGFNLGVVSFVLVTNKDYPVHKNIDYLRYTIWETLALVLQVRPLRISNIIVDHDANDLLVTFTLLDAPPRSALVKCSLEVNTAIQQLRTVIDANGLTFSVDHGDSKVTLRAKINSLQVVHTSFDETVEQCDRQSFARSEILSESFEIATEQNRNSNQNVDIIYKSWGPLTTGLWIGCIVLGVLIGTISGFFILNCWSKR